MMAVDMCRAMARRVCVCVSPFRNLRRRKTKLSGERWRTDCVICVSTVFGEGRHEGASRNPSSRCVAYPRRRETERRLLIDNNPIINYW